MAAYYNENDAFAARWLRNLIAAGKIAPGDVDERSIEEVHADDIKGYSQAHFFAGIGGWSLALRLAGWPDDRPVWTGSCPCQDYSNAGKQEAQDGTRHLWPTWKNIIVQRNPATIFGEQVANAITHGWLDEVACDLEAAHYSFAAAVLPACGIGAPHIRNRIFFVAHPTGQRVRGELGNIREAHGGQIGGLFQQLGSASKEPMDDSILAGLEGQPRYGENGAGGGGENAQTNCRVKYLWLTPSASEDAAGTVTGKMQKMLTHQAKEAAMTDGQDVNILPDQTEKPGQLSPEFVCWLMGFPAGWERYADLETL